MYSADKADAVSPDRRALPSTAMKPCKHAMSSGRMKARKHLHRIPTETE